ncbi:Oxysterol-binding protein-domain-containing protein [Lentinula edodes]|nr:Oxysterol-binding protein-domain-containing protein [Lentinula edodes]
MSRTSGASRKANSRFGYSDDGEDEDPEGMEEDIEYDEEHDGDNDNDGVSLPLPYSDTYAQQARLIFDQIEIMTTQLSFSSLQSLKNLISTYISRAASRGSHLLTNLTSTKHRLSGKRSSLSRTRKSLRTTKKSLRATKESLRASETARKKLEVTVKQAKRAQKAWEESMKVVLEEEVGLERQLKRTSRNSNSLKRGSKVLGSGPTSPILVILPFRQGLYPPQVRVIEKTTAAYATATATSSSSISTSTPLTVPDPSDVFTSSVTSTLASSPSASYSPYAYLCASLPIRAERPATSPWSALKNIIGKDLTKISFPVYFNEPTNMLLRMAVEKEFSECLDIASSTPSPHLRIAYIAAFATSNIV